MTESDQLQGSHAVCHAALFYQVIHFLLKDLDLLLRPARPQTEQVSGFMFESMNLFPPDSQDNVG